ncbi:MAG: homoserine kinase [Clostridia bacterium]|nr:homoserine kinase [Clostridia bacterium]
MVKVKVPATSANMGAGFDCLGVALGLYNYVEAEETDNGLVIDIKDSTADYLPGNERNLVYRSMKTLFDEVGYTAKGLHLVQKNDIPVTRGLGSSSAGIVGGLLAANEISKADLSRDEILAIAARIEGHPDNVAPAIMGGMTVNVTDFGKIKYVRTDVPEDLMFAAFVPEFTLSTKKARGVLPKTVSVRDAVFNMGRSALLMSSIMTGKYENIRAATADKLHQRYRKKFIPNIDDVFKAAYRADALGVYLSGAGPAVVAIIKADNENFVKKMNYFVKTKINGWNMHILKPDNMGAVVCEK